MLRSLQVLVQIIWPGSRHSQLHCPFVYLRVGTHCCSTVQEHSLEFLTKESDQRHLGGIGPCDVHVFRIKRCHDNPLHEILPRTVVGSCGHAKRIAFLVVVPR